MVDLKLYTQLPSKFAETVTGIYEGYKHYNQVTKKWNCEIVVHTRNNICIYPNMKTLLNTIK